MINLNTKGDYTAYARPSVQIEGSTIWMNDDIELLTNQWYGAIEIFDTPGMTMEKLSELCNLRDAKQGDMLNWLRKNYKTLYTKGKFWSDTK